MPKLLPAILLLFYCSAGSAQNILVFKKGSKTINRFWKGNFIAFQLKNKEWRKGEIMQIQNDSFYIRPRIIRYSLMSTDTFYYPVSGYAIADVDAMPRKGYLIDYIDGRFQIAKYAGHVHFYWVKSGWLFRTGAIGYAALNITNGLIKNDLSIKDGRLAIAAGVLLAGILLKRAYKPVHRLRHKYHLKMTNFSE